MKKQLQDSLKDKSMNQYEFQTTKDRYIGDIDPVTKLRHGEGIYSFENQFFQYKGQYQNGLKQGCGVLLMRDGSHYEGEFQDGEINGKGERKYADGSVYNGEFRQGEKHGYGEMAYAKNNEVYKGEWHLNIRQGQGTYQTKDKTTYTGEFRDHWPNGMCMIQFNNGSLYQGQVVKGVMHGKGQLTSLDKTIYEGHFENGKKHGPGRFYVQSGTYSLLSNFIDNKPEIEASQVILKIHKKEEEEEKLDPKGKKPDPKAQAKKGALAEEEKEDEGKNKIVYEVGKENNFIEFDLHIIYQGPPYEDPNPPPVEEDPKKIAAAAKGAKGKQPEAEVKPEIRMITPEPVLMVNENGRLFEYELGRLEKIKVETSTQEEGQEEVFEEKWVQYKFNQKKEALKDFIQTKEGICSVKELQYVLNDTFRSGTYEILIRDVTKGITNKFSEIKIELVIIDPEEIAAQQAALAAQVKGGAKKK